MTDNICNDEIRTIIEEAIREGKTLHDVALKLDKSKSTVRRWAAKYDLQFKNKSPWRLSKETNTFCYKSSIKPNRTVSIKTTTT